eukprot:CAMPEP_0113319962 /NCGR_PEP_ID=MMETSP0010_2-20120614/13950_1 /TAXON_ID=216773 ORGANISM="Corethron hystrix, Strain 308" /NCGR_SAMPLE_ID=MMETSP0010_2 /ASSEMBLY_ACC=CAM_ASM_000155 /LENGTH=176 /DNA_ID=CAMNT_0000177627 /DNA_START=133 /DNA_END=660 /DNA_ORIENTATION=- /assembly_acc=CAM_ASM_000155
MAGDDTFENLGKKIRALAKVNEEIIQILESQIRNNTQVIAGYDYQLNYSLPQNSDIATTSVADNSAEKFGFSAIPNRQYVKNLLHEWKYSGEALEKPDDIFNDKIDYNLKSYHNVKELIFFLPKVAEKFLTIARECPKVCKILRIFLSNLERLQVALGELNALTVDKDDDISNDEK